MAAIVQTFAPRKIVSAVSKDRAWRVVHACDSIRSVADVVEAQIAAGMRPFVLTGEAALVNASLLQTWSAVRTWKKYLEDADGGTHPLQGCIVHAHSFSAAMAGVRAGLATVYDVHAFVEDFSVAAGQCAERSWLARSFRAAEEFLLPRTGAVVVHSSLMRNACRQRGVAKDDLFLVPSPLHLLPAPDTGWLRRAFDFREDIVTVFARPNVMGDETLVRAFAQVVGEVPGVRLFVASTGAQALQLRRFAQEHQVDDLVFFLAPEDEDPALQAADIVLADWPIFPDDSSVARIAALTGPGTALAAMAHGRCLLAADCSAHRDLTAQGRGCLWFGTAEEAACAQGGPQSKDRAVDLAHRLSFLARNPDFRRALGEAARQHLSQTRDPERVGKMYREVCLHAHLRQHRGDDAPGQTPILVPTRAFS